MKTLILAGMIAAVILAVTLLSYSGVKPLVAVESVLSLIFVVAVIKTELRERIIRAHAQMKREFYKRNWS